MDSQKITLPVAGAHQLSADQMINAASLITAETGIILPRVTYGVFSCAPADLGPVRLYWTKFVGPNGAGFEFAPIILN